MKDDAKTTKSYVRYANPSTLRTQQLRQAYMEQKPSLCGDRSALVTESYRATEAMPPVLRQAIAFDKVLSEMPIWIQDNELIVANIASRLKGVFLFPEYDETWIGPEMDTISTRAGDPWLLNDEDKAMLKESLEYWPGKNLTAIVNAITPDEVKQAEMNSIINIDMGKNGGIGHVAPDIEGVISQGLNGLIEQAENQLNSLDLSDPADYEKMPFLQSVIIADKAVVKGQQVC